MVRERRFVSLVVAFAIALAATSVLAAHAMLSPVIKPTTVVSAKEQLLRIENDLRSQAESEFALKVEILSEWVLQNSWPRGRVSEKMARKIVRTTLHASTDQGIDPLLMLALIKVESAFDHTAVSSAGALGLTQIIPKWHAEKGVNNATAFDPVFSIRTGARILSEYRGWHNGDLKKALLQYNGSLRIPGATYADDVFRVQDRIQAFVKVRKQEIQLASSGQSLLSGG